MPYDVVKNRRENFAQLALRYPTRVALAHDLGRTPQQVGGLLNGTKWFGPRVARDIERHFDIPPGALDKPNWRLPDAVDPSDVSGKLTIPVLDIEMLNGTVVTASQSTQVDHMTVDRDWLYAQVVPTTSPQSLRILSASTDTMAPTIRRGDIVLVDISQNLLLADGVYVVRLGTTLTLKRLQKAKDTILLLHDNPKYETLEVKSDADMSIIGRCILVFNTSAL